MSNKRITDLTELTTPTTDDVFPVVDIATNTTTKVQLGNLPVPSSVTTALATKQDSLVSGTNIKTINSTSVLGSGNIAVQPTLVSGTSIKTVNSNSLLGSGDVAVQETLVSGTNIKTLNNTSLLGSGNIVLTANPSGVAGAIQFSNGSAFASDATNLFWDDTNNRLGVGTNAPSATAHIKGSGTTSATTSLLVQNSAGRTALKVADNGVVTIGADDKSGEQLAFVGLYGTRLRILTNSSVDGISGSVINSALDFTSNNLILSSKAASTTSNVYVIPTSFTSLSGSVLVNTTTDVASSVLTVNSTTKGVLFPRMTTTQKNAIASPAAGLVVYDSTTNKLCCYNGSTWNDLF
jgi:hypothetical protein